MARTNSFKKTPIVNTQNAIRVNLLTEINLNVYIYERIKTETTANNTKCKYAITIGLNPKARVLTIGIVEPNCKNNFIVKEMATNKNKYVWNLFKVVPDFTATLISFIILYHAHNCVKAANTTIK